MAGGVTSHLQGGNFWEGAAMGLTIGLLNHLAHEIATHEDPDPIKRYKKWFSAKMQEVTKSLNEWSANIGTAAGLTFDWATGTGSTNNIFIEGRVPKAMSNASRVNQARNFYYNKYKNFVNLKGTSVTNFDGSFGLSGLLKAGFDPIEQFVGSYRVDIYNVTGKSLWFVLTNTTSFESFLYGIGPAYSRSSFNLGGNTEQVYIWNEPIRR